jgi:hypothetical protein
LVLIQLLLSLEATTSAVDVVRMIVIEAQHVRERYAELVACRISVCGGDGSARAASNFMCESLTVFRPCE